jgi:hypothetical protein
MNHRRYLFADTVIMPQTLFVTVRHSEHGLPFVAQQPQLLHLIFSCTCCAVAELFSLLDARGPREPFAVADRPKRLSADAPARVVLLVLLTAALAMGSRYVERDMWKMVDSLGATFTLLSRGAGSPFTNRRQR